MAPEQRKTTYTAAEVAVLEETILKQKAEIDELKRKLEHMNEVFANAQRARFGQSSEQKNYVLGKDQLSLFNEAESSQDHKAEEPNPNTIFVEAHERKKKRSQTEMLNNLPEEEVLLEIPEGQLVTAQSIGMTWLQAYRRVILPQAAVFALPLFANQFLSTMKSTSIVFVITVIELFGAAKLFCEDNSQYFEAYMAVACLYWAMGIIFEFLFDRLEYRLSRFRRGNAA